MQVKIEVVTPGLAQEWLALSKGNRRLSEGFVLSLAVSMEGGDWIPEASEIVFDNTGALIDGHHRLSAVEVYGKPVPMAVKRGVSPDARNVIDTGRTRSTTDLLGMYRGNVDYINQRRSALNICVLLLAGLGRDSHKLPQIRTLVAYDSWMRHFREGIDWAIHATLASAAGVSSRTFARGPVLGAFAFAHRSNPTEVSAFHRAALTGEGLKTGHPALTLRNYVLAGDGSSRNGVRAAGNRKEIAIKTLSAIYAHMTGGGHMMKLVANSQALPFFRAAYKGRAVDKLVASWEAAPEAPDAR
jgi:hypothetical protein